MELVPPPYRFVCIDTEETIAEWLDENAIVAIYEPVILAFPSGRRLTGCIIEFDDYVEVVAFLFEFHHSGLIVENHRQTDK